MVHTTSQKTADRTERTDRRTAEKSAQIPMQALLRAVQTGTSQLPPELFRQLAGELGNSAMLELVSRQRRPEAPEWPAQDSAVQTPPAAVEPAAPLLVQPPAGFGG